ncbi:MAG TPA: RusA family crossover junction endodeoxyribonuclease [Nitrospirales bacterium]|nr:RusA family crossover junction endodeoxyribonuclease [Nitrospirales bacterium]
MRTIRIPSLPKVTAVKRKGGLILLPSHTRKSRSATTHLEWNQLGGDSLTPSELFLVLPLPPSINHQYATVNGRRVLASKGRQYKTAVANHLQGLIRQSPHRADFFEALGTHFLSLSIRFYFKTALRRDLDGGLKIAQDAICQAISLNDNRISEIHLYKDSDSVRPRMECRLAMLSPLPCHSRPSRPRHSADSRHKPNLPSAPSSD